ncbi:hypothetical protein [Ruoffia tabacinasalis]|jgi:hypothetical protein|uniref:Preprotein translocase subunit SecY n=1 Tax=Ruoffia tabacinasalis TaxID=87458 RepID=A0ABS0LLE8_9LACT|nr:hypothetical protein [Ruoffia tabacinasalis]MBG9979053.1 hypothetical protein [Ruoffia tabacinasalis]
MNWKNVGVSILLSSLTLLPIFYYYLYANLRLNEMDNAYRIIVMILGFFLIIHSAILNQQRPYLPKALFTRQTLVTTEDVEGFFTRLLKSYLGKPLIWGGISGLLLSYLSPINYTFIFVTITVMLIDRTIDGEQNIRRYNQGEFRE